MGCANSKQKRRCRHCQAPFSPVHRSNSMNNEPRHDRRPKANETHHHVVALKSSTLGSLKLDEHYHDEEVVNFEKEKDFFRMGLIEAKTWSDMIEEKIPKMALRTPVATPPGEPETINAWELMEGLEDVVSPLRSPAGNHVRSFSFDVPRSPSRGRDDSDDFVRPASRFKQEGLLQMANDDELKFDPEVISSFRKSCEELSPSHPFHIRPLTGESKPSDLKPTRSFGNERVVVYFTSLRGVRKTYEDCCHVRLILKAVGVRVDERDVSMHSGFKEELRELLGGGFGLPMVFAGREYIGGAEEIKKLHEEGKLEKLLENCERVGVDGKDGNLDACEACGDIRFVLCETCSGSCKIFCGDEFDEGGEEEEEEGDRDRVEDGEEYGFQRCPDCNENGLVRCPICCD